MSTGHRSLQRPGFLALALLLVPAVAHAHPKVVASSPAANAAVPAPRTIQLRFNERLVTRFTGAELVMTAMPGTAAHAPMKMPLSSAKFAPDGKTLLLAPKAPLPKGSYKVAWRAVGKDTHRVTGEVPFTVK